MLKPIKKNKCKHEWIIYGGWQNIDKDRDYAGVWGVNWIYCVKCSETKEI